MPLLYIIGNGFDLCHGIHSAFCDYKDWLNHNGHNDHVRQIEDSFFIQGQDWANYEEALGKYSVDDMYEYITDGLEVDLDHLMRSQAIFEDAPDVMMGEFWRDIKDLFCEWVRSIDINVTPKFPFQANSYYFTFNYTKTLETVYSIPDDNICHIHGIVHSDHLIVGHNNLATHNPNYHGNQWEMADGVRERIISAMNDNYKDVKGILKKHATYFESLNHITDIKVIGHSYNSIDMPYFTEIKNTVSAECKWDLYYYTEKDKIAAQNMAISVGINPNIIQL